MFRAGARLLSIEEVELIHPEFLDVSRVHPTVTVRRLSPSQKCISTYFRAFHTFLMNIIGGKSSKYHEAGISTSPVIGPPSSG
jgi:hypothetical protein